MPSYYFGAKLHQPAAAALARRPSPAPRDPEAYRRGLAAMARVMSRPPAPLRPPVQVRLAPPPPSPSLHRLLATMGAIDAMATDRQRIEARIAQLEVPPPPPPPPAEIVTRTGLRTVGLSIDREAKAIMSKQGISYAEALRIANRR